jgi:uridine kinase
MEKSRTSSNLIIVSGLAATGKTFIAKQIADYLQLPLISKDKIKELLYLQFIHLMDKRRWGR